MPDREELWVDPAADDLCEFPLGDTGLPNPQPGVLAALVAGIGADVFWNDARVPFIVASVDRAALVQARAALAALASTDLPRVGGSHA